MTSCRQMGIITLPRTSYDVLKANGNKHFQGPHMTSCRQIDGNKRFAKDNIWPSCRQMGISTLPRTSYGVLLADWNKYFAKDIVWRPAGRLE